MEAVIARWPGVADAAVYGVQIRGRDGRCGMASLTPAPGAVLNLDALALHLAARLPKYAVPRFLRLSPGQALTDTFKHRKSELKRQGYDIAQGSDPVYYLAPGAPRCVALTPALRLAIERGEAAV